jgi:UDP-sugar transporter A1/2/3
MYVYKTITIPLAAELMKVMVSTALFSHEYVKSDGKMYVDYRYTTVLMAAIPAFLYFITNNINFVIIRELGASNFQLLNNLKILTTAIFFCSIMRVNLSGLQWRMLLLLTIGCITSQFDHKRGDQGVLVGSIFGYGLKILNSCLTAIASVYCEKFLKHVPNSFHFQNLLLYTWGAVFAMCSILIEGEIFTSGTYIFRGHTCSTFLLICSYAFGGIATSGVLKYLDNIAKTIATSGSSFLVAFICVARFKEQFRIELIWGCLIASVAVDVYYNGELHLRKGKKTTVNLPLNLTVLNSSDAEVRKKERDVPEMNTLVLN